MKAGRFLERARDRFSGRRKIWLFAAAAGLAVAATAFMPTRPDPADWARATAGARQWSVMSFNVQRGGAPASDALDAVDAAQPDILCLQEMTPELAEMFKIRFGKRYPHRYFKPGRMTQGVGIASRHPLLDGTVLTLGLTYLPAVSATVRTESGLIRVACVHLMPPFARFKKSVNVWKRYFRNQAIRMGQVAELLKHLDRRDIPAIILGDMNELPGQLAVSLIGAAGFADACGGVAARCGPTWPGGVIPLPAMFRIDHIHGRGVSFDGTAALEAGGSDHYPVAARFRIGDRTVALGEK